MKSFKALCLLAPATLALAACSGSEPVQPTDVLQTPQGPVQGIVSSDNPDIVSYQGIPFAAPPVGDLRWRPPAPAANWTEVRDASAFGSRCMQPSGTEGGFFERLIDGHGLGAVKSFLIKRVVAAQEPSPMSEDCLYLNVRAPKNADNAPVMVWIHGGGHQFGSSDFSYYQADGLAEQGVVLVTTNYRLGPMGYMAHPALSADDPRGVSGNYGSLDQVAALEWVRDNISAYGGDPDNVTIFGESAGAWSVTEMMSTALATGLFDRAILQSGASTYHLGRLDEDALGWPSGYSGGLAVADALGLENPSAADLRAVPADDIYAVLTEEMADTFHHNRDGVVFPENVGLAFETGIINAVPMMAGYNADEGTLFFPDDPQPSVWLEDLEPADRATLIDQLSDAYPENAAAIVDAYNLDTDFMAGGEAMMGDELFGVNIRYAARQVAETGQPSWTYFFSRVPPSETQTVGAFHAAEIPFVFDSHEPALGKTDDDAALTDAMVSYWSNFAKFGDPNGSNASSLPVWPEHNGTNWMHFSANRGLPVTQVETDIRDEKLDLLSEGLALKLTALSGRGELEASPEPITDEVGDEVTPAFEGGP